MKNTFKILLILLLTFIFSNALNANEDENVRVKSKVLYAKYTSLPKIVYTKQQFNVTIQSNILLSFKKMPYKLSTSFQKTNSSVKLMTKDITWNKISKNVYQTKLKFKVMKKNVLLPIIRIKLLDKNNNNTIDSTLLKSKKILFQKIAVNQKEYSNIIAKDLQIVSIKTKQYTNKELIHIIKIIGDSSNLEEFKLANYKHQTIKELEVKENIQTLYYSLRTPRGQKKINFSYYNTSKHALVNLSASINIKESLVSTQTDLNPYDNDMLLFKQLIISVPVLIFLMIYYFKKEFFYLFLAIMFMSILIYMMYPNKKMLLTKNTKIYILPTSTSTIFNILQKDHEVEILINNKRFKKVLFKNKSIGWIKHE